MKLILHLFPEDLKSVVYSQDIDVNCDMTFNDVLVDCLTGNLIDLLGPVGNYD
jgi:hypothetical protein